MSDYELVVIGGGLSGLAAGIRAARFGCRCLILERHHRVGGLISWYRRQGVLLETGLHAMTNFAPASDKRAPLNRLFRQLKLSRKRFLTRPQHGSEIRFPGRCLRFSNDLSVLTAEVAREFPDVIDRFRALLDTAESFDPFTPAPWRSARAFLHQALSCPELERMLLLPLMVYGNAEEHDMDLAQFMIMFRALFLEGFFRPEQTIRGVRLASGEEITAGAVVSTVGLPGTAALTGWDLEREKSVGRMSFMETISLLDGRRCRDLARGRTIVFYSRRDDWDYCRPDDLIDPSWGVICFPEQFAGIPAGDRAQLRVTHAANHDRWRRLDPESYREAKKRCQAESVRVTGKIVGNYAPDIVYQDSFTPLTIERFTGKAAGAVYGSPVKIRDGRTPWANLFLAGTDQGYLGIVGAMLSGVTMVNQHLLRPD